MNAKGDLVWLFALLLGFTIVRGAPATPTPPAWSWNLPIYETSLDLATPTGKYWITEFGVDGFREDVAGALPQQYWQWLRPRLNAIKPVLMLAEDEPPTMHPAFDLTYDCTSQVSYVAFYRALFQAYRRNPALYKGDFARISVSRPEAVYAFSRRDGPNRAVVAVNLTEKPRHVMLEVGAAAGAYTEVFTAEPRTLGAREDMELEPWAYKVYLTGTAGQAHAGTVKVCFGQKLGPLKIDRMSLGQGGLSDEPMWDSRIAEIRSLNPRLIRLFIQEYFRLLPERGHNHFESLDRSVDTILKTGAKPLMCLCFKPGLLFGPVDQDRVEPDDYEAWSDLIFRLVKHYKDRGAGIRYWEVANEPDIGESGGCPYRFKPESYVRYYRHTAAAILKADPSALVGGPALASVRSPILPALLDACDGGASPLGFISWHIYSSDPARVRGTIEFAKGLLRKHPTLKPETILDEWNMDLQDPPLDPRFQPCYLLEVIWQMKDAGLDWSCYYQIRDYHVRHEQFAPFFSPQGAAFMAKWWNRMPQFDGLFDYQNHVRPSFFAFKLLSRLTGDRVRVDSTLATVHGFATHDEQDQIDNLLLWNFSDSSVTVELILEGLSKDVLVRPLMLDAVTPSDEENARLRPEPRVRLSKGTHHLKVELGPRAVKFWSFE